jgi:hypothetical protein
MRRRAQEVTFTSILLLLVVWFLVETLRLGRIARMVPLAVVLPTLVLVVAQLIRDFVPARMREAAAAPLYGIQWLRIVVTTTLFSRVTRARDAGPPLASVAVMLAWLGAMLALIYLVGLIAAIPLFTLAYLRWHARERWRTALTVAAGVTAIPFALQHFRIEAGLADGMLWSWLGS